MNSTAFELRSFSTDSKFNECFKCFVVECEFVNMLVLRLITYAQRTQTNLFLKFNLSHKLQVLNVQHNYRAACNADAV